MTLRIRLLALCCYYSSVNSVLHVVLCCTFANVCNTSAACVVTCLRCIVLLQLHKRNCVLHISFVSVKLIVVCFCSAVVLRFSCVSCKQLCKHFVCTLLFVLLLTFYSKLCCAVQAKCCIIKLRCCAKQSNKIACFLFACFFAQCYNCKCSN